MSRKREILEVRVAGLTGEFVYRHWPQIRYLAQHTPHGHAMRVLLEEPVSAESFDASITPSDPVRTRVVYLVAEHNYWQEQDQPLKVWLTVVPQSEKDTELLRKWEREYQGAL